MLQLLYEDFTMRWLLVVAVFVVLYYFLLQRRTIRERKNRFKECDRDGYSRNNPSEEVLCECKRCGTFVAQNEAFMKDGHYYCSKECAYH